MHWPLTAKPLGVLPLAQGSFTHEWELWLKSLTCDFKYLFPSFHLPKSNLREVPHQSIKKFLHNFRSWEEQMWIPELEVRSAACPCNQFQHKLPDFSVQGHVAAGLEAFESFLPKSSSVALASAASTFCPGRNNWKARSRALFDLWLKRNRLPHALHAVFEKFCDEQCALHVQALQESDRLTRSKVQELHDLFVHEDHHPNHAVCYCPQFFMRSISTILDDPATFENLQGSPGHWQQEMLKSKPSKLFKHYAWAINPGAELPRGTVFLKRKKNFRKVGQSFAIQDPCAASYFNLRQLSLQV